ncbi:unnamed protein product [Peronospora farinosa]|uniref:Ankyrin repeat-containing domain n=1 Tax=Peronospora farinosa TaxID=134698 RepID=A0ABN8C9L8_9STRA|nr:unnamed protein product [Peronospora farinosa]
MVDDAAVDSQDAIAHAAANGRLDLVQWYCDMKDRVLGNRCTRRGLEKAALHGHLKVVQWLNNSRYYEIKTFRTLENAIAGGHLHVVQYVMETVVVAYTSWMQAALAAAVMYGQCQILQWLHDRASVEAAVFDRRFRFEIHTYQLYTVAREGYLGVLQWLHANNYSVHCRRAHVVRGAATGGHKAIIEWMENTFESLSHQRHRIRVDGAASLGDLQFIIRFGFEAVSGEAREHNHFELLRWLETLPEAGRYC